MYMFWYSLQLQGILTHYFTVVLCDQCKYKNAVFATLTSLVSNYCITVTCFGHLLWPSSGFLEIIAAKWHERTLFYIPSKWWTVEFQFSCCIPVKQKICGKLVLCYMLVDVPTTKCQESSAVQEMPHQCSISLEMASLLSDWTRKRCALVSITCGHKTQNICTSTDRLCLCMVQLWYPFNRCGNGFVALQMVG